MAEVKKYSRADVKKHNKKTDLWIIIRDKVYDVTKFLTEHPGGEDVLVEAAGKDATKDFDEVGHSEAAISQLKDFYVGDVIDAEKSSNKEIPLKSICLGASVVVGVAVGLFVLYRAIKTLKSS